MGIGQEVETEIVISLARDDGATAIAEKTGVAVQTVYDVKARNLPAIQAIKATLLKKKEVAASRILDKANEQLEQTLDANSKYEEKLAEIQMEYENSEGTDEDKALFRYRLSALKRTTVAELVSISKEAFNQSQIEQNQPTLIPGSSGSRDELKALMEAIENGDEVKLREMVINPHD